MLSIDSTIAFENKLYNNAYDWLLEPDVQATIEFIRILHANQQFDYARQLMTISVNIANVKRPFILCWFLLNFSQYDSLQKAYLDIYTESPEFIQSFLNNPKNLNVISVSDMLKEETSSMLEATMLSAAIKKQDQNVIQYCLRKNYQNVELLKEIKHFSEINDSNFYMQSLIKKDTVFPESILENMARPDLPIKDWRILPLLLEKETLKAYVESNHASGRLIDYLTQILVKILPEMIRSNTELSAIPFFNGIKLNECLLPLNYKQLRYLVAARCDLDGLDNIKVVVDKQKKYVCVYSHSALSCWQDEKGTIVSLNNESSHELWKTASLSDLKKLGLNRLNPISFNHYVSNEERDFSDCQFHDIDFSKFPDETITALNFKNEVFINVIFNFEQAVTLAFSCENQHLKLQLLDRVWAHWLPLVFNDQNISIGFKASDKLSQLPEERRWDMAEQVVESRQWVRLKILLDNEVSSAFNQLSEDFLRWLVRTTIYYSQWNLLEIILKNGEYSKYKTVFSEPSRTYRKRFINYPYSINQLKSHEKCYNLVLQKSGYKELNFNDLITSSKEEIKALLETDINKQAELGMFDWQEDAIKKATALNNEQGIMILQVIFEKQGDNPNSIGTVLSIAVKSKAWNIVQSYLGKIDVSNGCRPEFLNLMVNLVVIMLQENQTRLVLDVLIKFPKYWLINNVLSAIDKKYPAGDNQALNDRLNQVTQEYVGSLGFMEFYVASNFEKNNFDNSFFLREVIQHYLNDSADNLAYKVAAYQCMVTFFKCEKVWIKLRDHSVETQLLIKMGQYILNKTDKNASHSLSVRKQTALKALFDLIVDPGQETSVKQMEARNILIPSTNASLFGRTLRLNNEIQTVFKDSRTVLGANVPVSSTISLVA